jgi:fatty-acyl-CoA synthase
VPGTEAVAGVNGDASPRRRRVLRQSHWSADTDEAILDSTIATILQDTAERVPDRLALVAGTADPATRIRRTYREVTTDARAVARTLAARFTPGERVAVLAPGTPEFFVLSFAAAMARLVLVPMNPLLREDEIAHVLSRSGAAGAFFVAQHRGNDLATALDHVRGSLADLRELIPFDDWPTMLEHGLRDDRPLPPPGPDDVAQIVFTSGTTGAPKGAMLTHRGMCNAARLGGARFGLGAGDVYVNTIPLYHVGGQGVTFQIVQALATNVLVTQFEPGLQLELIECEKATHTVGVPTMWLAVMDHPDFADRDLSTLRTISTGGSAVPAELIRRIERELDARTTIVFGQTEACGFVSQTFLDDDPEDKASTIGCLLPRLEGRLVDPRTGTVVPVGDVGELQIRGYSVMAGYFNDPDATGATIDADGWLHTGDLATKDSRGYLRITGRLKEMIVSGGINVYPVEVEAAIATHPSVATVAVVGMPDPRWGESVVAVVLPKEGERSSAEELEAFARQRLAPYKVPKRWVFVEELPMTTSGKVQKFLLREELDRDARPSPGRPRG